MTQTCFSPCPRRWAAHQGPRRLRSHFPVSVLHQSSSRPSVCLLFSPRHSFQTVLNAQNEKPARQAGCRQIWGQVTPPAPHPEGQPCVPTEVTIRTFASWQVPRANPAPKYQETTWGLAKRVKRIDGLPRTCGAPRGMRAAPYPAAATVTSTAVGDQLCQCPALAVPEKGWLRSQ